MEQQIKELCEKYAKKRQYDIISIQYDRGYANFKEYDGDGYFKVKKTFLDIINEL